VCVCVCVFVCLCVCARARVQSRELASVRVSAWPIAVLTCATRSKQIACANQWEHPQRNERCRQRIESDCALRRIVGEGRGAHRPEPLPKVTHAQRDAHSGILNPWCPTHARTHAHTHTYAHTEARAHSGTLEIGHSAGGCVEESPVGFGASASLTALRMLCQRLLPFRAGQASQSHLALPIRLSQFPLSPVPRFPSPT
jgi:hypothetical protein